MASFEPPPDVMSSFKSSAQELFHDNPDVTRVGVDVSITGDVMIVGAVIGLDLSGNEVAEGESLDLADFSHLRIDLGDDLAMKAAQSVLAEIQTWAKKIEAVISPSTKFRKGRYHERRSRSRKIFDRWS